MDPTLFVISDLHLGGDGDFRMMRNEPALAKFVRKVAKQPGDVELVINGDFVDFLAELDRGRWHAFVDDPEAARRIMKTIMNDRPAKDVFDALGELTESGRKLTILLGNHDIELTYNVVIDALLARIGNRNVRLIFDNTAYRPVRNVLIEHGNRCDSANRVDHDGLRRYRSLRSRDPGATPKKARFAPPAGSRLVAEVMNPIKAKYQFIDLLKPETAPLLALILALEPELRPSLKEIARFLVASYKHRSAAHAEPSFEGDMAATQTVIGAWFPDAIGPDFEADAASVGDTAAALQGIVHVLLTRELDITKRGPDIKKALRALDENETFILDAEASMSPYRQSAELRTSSAGGARTLDYVIYGHTHLAKQVTLETGATYINTGTWADLMQYPRAFVAPTTLAAPVDSATTLAAPVDSTTPLDPMTRPTTRPAPTDGATPQDPMTQFLLDIKANRHTRRFTPYYARITVDDSGWASAASLASWDHEHEPERL